MTESSHVLFFQALLSTTPRSDMLEKICDMYYGMLGRHSSSDLLRQVLASLKLLVKNVSLFWFMEISKIILFLI